MQKNVCFNLEDVIEVPDWANAYPEHKFTVYKCCFLSTKENSHRIPITEDILKKYASTILGNFLIAKIEWGDATTHKDSEVIYGYFPREQEIEFIKEEDIVKAYAYAVVSKRYSKEFNGIFEFDNLRNSSVEMAVSFLDETEEEVVGLDIYGLTCLGKTVNGSCPDANIKMVRFSQKKAESYFKKNDNLSALKSFVQERNKVMSDKTYKIDKSKESMSEKPWGEVDKSELRNKIMEASNKSSIVKEVYLLVEDGWEEAPSEKLKYPVMELKGDTFVYNRDALASALGYAKKENETTVVNKVEAIYKKLDLNDSEGKEEDAKMTEENMSIEEMEEEVKEEEMAESEPNTEEEKEEAKEEEMAEQTEEVEECDPVLTPSIDELMAKIEKLEKDVEDRDNIIMGNEAELAELRNFKACVEEKEKAMAIESIMAEVKDYLNDTQFTSLREEGMACEKDGIDAFANKARAMCFSAVKKQPKKKDNTEVWSFGAPVESVNESVETDIWARLRKNYK